MRICIDRRGMSQKDLADLLNVTEVTVSRWINGTRQPKADYIVVICLRLGISADWLLGMLGE